MILFDADGLLAELKTHYPPRRETAGLRGLCRMGKFITSRRTRSTPRRYQESKDVWKVTCLRCLRILAERGTK